MAGAIVGFFLLVLSQAGFTATYYVDNRSGSDFGNGSASRPWATLPQGAQQLVGGDTLIVKYNGPMYPYRDSLQFYASGVSGQPISVRGESASTKPVVIGSLDWSDSEFNDWYEESDGVYSLGVEAAPSALWVASQSAWESRGPDALSERAKRSVAALQPGQWGYSSGSSRVHYALLPGESIAQLHIEGVTKDLLLDISRHDHIQVSNLHFMFSGKTAVAVQKSASHITLDELQISRAFQNGIAVSSGHDIHIQNCAIQDVVNNGIVFSGSSADSVSNSSISGCRIQRVAANDCITLHTDSVGDHIGSGIVIQDNHVSHCHEQGIDVTSGSNIVVRRNTTHDNGDSGIVVGHGVSNVEIANHLSVDDGRFAGVYINDATDVELRDSCIIGSEKHQLIVDRGRGVTLRRNVLYQPSTFEGSLIDILRDASDISLLQNHILSESDSEVLLLRYLQSSDPRLQRVSYQSNTWSAPAHHARRFYTTAFDKHSLAQHDAYYGRSGSDVFVSGEAFASLAQKLFDNGCDLGKAPRSYMASVSAAPTPTTSGGQGGSQSAEETGGAEGQQRSGNTSESTSGVPSLVNSGSEAGSSSQGGLEGVGSGANSGTSASDAESTNPSSGSRLVAGDWTTVSGNVLFGDLPACALVLINGRSQFTCNGEGRFELYVPVDERGEITVMAFADGFEPFTQIFQPDALVDRFIDISPSDLGLEAEVTADIADGSVSGRALVSGAIRYNGEPVCTLVLANGVEMFSCGESLGEFSLDVPLDASDDVTVMVFASGFKPYRRVLHLNR